MKRGKMMKRKLLWIVAIGVVIRLLFINTPMVDAFGSMRQTYTAGYTRYMIENGVSVDAILNSPSIVNSHHALEIPLYNLLTVGLARIFGDTNYIYRLTSLLIWLAGALYLAYLLRRVYGEKEAAYILWTYTLLPLSIFLGHYYHPEILSILLSLAVIFHYYFYLETGKPIDLAISVVALAIALVVRASHFHLYFALIFIGLSKHGWRIFTRLDSYAYILPLIPAAIWSMRGSDLATGTRIYQYMGPLSLRLSPKFWGMIIFNRLGGLTLSPVGLPLLVLGAAASRVRVGRVIEFAWLYASLLFILIVAAGNFHHPHYQAPILIPAALVIGRFIYQIREGNLAGAWQNWWKSIPTVVWVAALSLFLFFDGVVIYLFFTQPWDAEALKELVKSLKIVPLFIAFAVSMAVLIPGIMYIIRREQSKFARPRPFVALLLLAFIFVTGLFVLHPMYRLELDYLEAGKSVQAFAEDHDAVGKVIFAGKKDDADPFIFYSEMRGWAFNPATFLYLTKDDPREKAELGEPGINRGWAFLDKYIKEGADYLAVMKGNRYIQDSYERSGEVNAELAKLKPGYEDAVVTIYDLTGEGRPAAIE